MITFNVTSYFITFCIKSNLKESQSDDKDAKVICWQEEKPKEKSENKSFLNTLRNFFLGPEKGEFGMVKD